MDILQIVAKEFKVNETVLKNTVALIDEGNTIPFIARYRKEVTNSMDDQILREIDERVAYLRGLVKRKEEVTSSITEQGAMTDELAEAIEKAVTLSAVEDIYRPYKPKRKTRASIAKQRGLEPLSIIIFAQETSADPLELAEEYVNEENEVPTKEVALQGALDIIAENISDSADIRNKLRNFYTATAIVDVKATDKDKESVYTGYYEFSQPVNKIASHRVLAIDRGEKENFLKVSVVVEDEKAINLIINSCVTNSNLCSDAVKLTCEDAFSRLIHPSLEREVRSNLTQTAADGAIKVFSQNLKQLLLQPPIKGKITLSLDPGYRMGCKVAVVDRTGKVLDTTVIYPVPEFKRVEEAKTKVKQLIKKFGVEIIAVGNGTASKETEIFTAEIIKEIEQKVSYMMVNEAGASVYSASKLGAAEFPNYDVNVRSAISIARRLQDPLAELVKIEPKAVGVGQYQHDMPQAQLNTALDGVVEYCVNTVGVDLNTASAPLLARVVGIGTAVAKNVVAYREDVGEFTQRKQLLKVPKLGPKAFTQCAGFLRITDAKNKLDSTAVHPESYDAAKKLLDICGFTINDIGTDNIKELKKIVEVKGIKNIAEEINVGAPTLADMVEELLRPGRDMRDELPAPMLRTDVMDINDLKAGMELKGTVRNVIDFGAFVDISVHQDGLVHISQICDRFIKHPSEVLKVGDVVTVWVMSVDIPKKRIALTMKKPENQN